MGRTPLEILKSVFGYDAFRDQQQGVIDHLVSGGDALVLMPTGGGKSLCYQVPTLARGGTGIVISPLIALMQNQVDRLRELGVKAAYLNSTLSSREAQIVEARVHRGELDFLYVAPERLVMPGTIELLKRARLALFAVDEAHCISQWGHDFRKDYLELSLLAREFPGVPRIALTATANERTRQEIVARLDLRNCKVFVSSFNRPNIQYRVTEKRQAREQLLKLILDEHQGDAGIVYCLTRDKVETTAAWLAEKGLNALPYHAGLATTVRQTHLDRFLREDGVIVVATIAFGMGIDKPDVRFVAHLDLPKNLEAYYQETGRAGRDGQPATAWLAYGIQDVIMLRQMASSSDGDDAFKRVELQKIQAMLGFCEVASCRRQVLLKYFGETPKEPCGNCDTCLEPVITWDGTVSVQKALSCIYRTQQRFGVNHLIDVLLGRPTDRIRALRHDQVSTFGIGGEHDEMTWRSIFRQLLTKGLVRVDEYGALQLHESAKPVLRGTERMQLRQMRVSTRTKRRRKDRDTARYKSRRGAETSSTPQGLWQRLSRHRLELAKSQNLPSYCIFHNSTLEEIARLQPKTLAELRCISGVGETKLSKYGEGFLQVIRDWRQTSSHRTEEAR